MNTTIDLIKKIDEIKSRGELNNLAYELACRIYVPFSGINFDDLLYRLGYRPANYNDLLFDNPKEKKL